MLQLHAACVRGAMYVPKQDPLCLDLPTGGPFFAKPSMLAIPPKDWGDACNSPSLVQEAWTLGYMAQPVW
jgi:hypothetical protein